MRIVTYDRKSHFMTNSKTLVIPAQTKTMDDTHLASILGLGLAIFWWAPKTVQGICLLIVCAVIGFLYLGPFAINTAQFFSHYYSFLGFLDPQANPAVIGLSYVAAMACSYPIIVTIMRVAERLFPKWLKGKFSGITNS